MSLIPQIPDWFIAKGIRPGGIRMEKRPTPPVEKWASYQPSPYLPMFNPLIKGGSRAEISVEGDTLSGGDLRYWVGYNNPASKAYAACRACGEVHLKREDRKKHLKNMGCGRLLTEAYKALLRDKKCVICDEVTVHRTFGVPLCNKDCVQEWSYTTRCSSALHLAIDYVKTWEKDKL